MRIRLTIGVGLIVLLLGTFEYAPATQAPSALGTVKGKVIDSDTQQPVTGARVEAESEEGSVGNWPPNTTTDARGEFVLKRLPPGTYVLAASKEVDFYPDSDTAAFESGVITLPHVSIHEGEVVRDVVIAIKKGGRLVGAIRDAHTGAPIINSSIRLARADNSKLWISIGPDSRGIFNIAIPAAVKFAVEVSAPKYHKWTSSDSRPNGFDMVEAGTEATTRLTVLLTKD